MWVNGEFIYSVTLKIPWVTCFGGQLKTSTFNEIKERLVKKLQDAREKKKKIQEPKGSTNQKVVQLIPKIHDVF